jgi:hypothetical protein
MWNEQERYLKSQLAVDELMLWSGQPKQGVFFRPADVYAIPISLLWAGFAVFWNAAVWYSDGPVFFRLWGIPFLIVGFYIVIGRFFVDAWKRSKTYYGVTNERAIITSGIFSKIVKSLNLRTLTDITILERRDLSGTITFGPVDQQTKWPFGLPMSNGRNEATYPIFDSIQNAKRVYDIIRDAQRNAK